MPLKTVVNDRLAAFRLVFVCMAIWCLSVSFGSLASAERQKTVCSITINSDHEIKAMKAAFPPRDFQFVELTEFGSKESDSSNSSPNHPSSVQSSFEIQPEWLRKSCQAGIRCDVLVVSGHFGGVFFGDTNLRLGLEEMELAACDPTCSGIFNAPREVFLFGCNTLAGKVRDRRSPEEYLRVLLTDGFSRAQAEQIVAWRYSPIGESFHDRMARVYATVPRLYGFSSLGPRGAIAGPMMTRYLNDTAPHYVEHLSSIDSSPNQPLLRAFQSTTLIQSQGASRRESPVCLITDPRQTHLTKLTYIDEALKRGRVLELANYLTKYFKNLPMEKLSVEERARFESIRQNRAAVRDLEAITERPIPAILKPQIDLLNFMSSVGWLSKEKYNESARRLVLDRLFTANDLTFELKDQLCSLGLSSIDSIDPSRIPPRFWSNRALYWILGCLKPQNSEMALALFQQYKTNKYHSSAILEAMSNAGLKHPQITAYFLGRIMTASGNELFSISSYMRSVDLREIDVVHAVQKAYEARDDRSVKATLRELLVHIGREVPSVILPILKDGLKAPTASGSFDVFQSLASVASKSETIRSAIKAAFEKPSSSQELANSIHAMIKFDLKYPELQEQIKKVALANEPIQLRAIAVRALWQFNQGDSNFRDWLEKFISSHQAPPQVRYAALSGFLEYQQRQAQPLRLARLYLMEKDGFLAESILLGVMDTVQEFTRISDETNQAHVRARRSFFEDPVLNQVATAAKASPEFNQRVLGGRIEAAIKNAKR